VVATLRAKASSSLRRAGVALALASLALPAAAQSRLSVDYVGSLAGVTVGRGTLSADFAASSYRAEAGGRAAGLSSMLSSGRGDVSVSGSHADGRVVPQSYALNTASDGESRSVRLTMAGLEVVSAVLTPAPRPRPNRPQGTTGGGRIPVTDEHRRRVIDPFSAVLIPVGGTGDVVSAAACNRTLPVFTGSERVDLALSFKRMDAVKAERGYRGPVVVCGVSYRPIAGHRPDREAIRYLEANRDIEVWLAPVAGTRFLAPFRLQGPTPVGTAMLEATRFEVTTRTAETPAAAAPRN
jgi:hypothetical protein